MNNLQIINKLDTMIKKQLNNIHPNKKLDIEDMKRIIKFTDNCIITSKECVLWKGFITNNKNTYINFYFKGKKIALHRLLYINYINKLYDNQYLTFNCNSKGLCCNINHFIIKKKYQNINNNTVSFNI
jgi:hypothetical protein